MIAKLLKIGLLIVSISIGMPMLAFAEEKHIAGWIERVSIYPGNIKIKAKLDTGAKISSLNAKNLEQFKRNGDTWVRFEVLNFKKRQFKKRLMLRSNYWP